jgi:hypothetical protein
LRKHSYAHFGYWEKPPRARKYHWFPDENLQYAQPHKSRHGRKVKFLYSVIRLGAQDIIREVLLALELSGLVQTSYIERANLTLRELIAPLSRRTWSLAYDVDHLWLHIQWGLAYYHFCRVHQALEVRVRGLSRCRYRTPAMAAGLTRRRWLVAQILMMLVPEQGWLAPFLVAWALIRSKKPSAGWEGTGCPANIFIPWSPDRSYYLTADGPSELSPHIPQHYRSGGLCRRLQPREDW